MSIHSVNMVPNPNPLSLKNKDHKKKLSHTETEINVEIFTNILVIINLTTVNQATGM